MKDTLKKIAGLCGSVLDKGHSYNDLKACLQQVKQAAEEAAKAPARELKDQLDLVETRHLFKALERRSECLVIFQDPKTDEAPKICAYGGYAALGLIDICRPHLVRTFSGGKDGAIDLKSGTGD
jgi:hypothetical protein